MYDLIKNNFIVWYHNVFCHDKLYIDMQNTTEDSPWHREGSVAVHTNMVVDQFISTISPEQVWNRDDSARALVCAFHDVGKPDAKEEVYSESRGNYFRFAGHEKTSARLWEDYAVRNWIELRDTFNLTPYHIYKIGWMIEYHKPWDIKKPNKLKAIARTVSEITWADSFGDVLLSDALGRITDNHQEHIKRAHEWLTNFNSVMNELEYVANKHIPDDAPVVYVLIGASGSGKSTWSAKNQEDRLYYSWDLLRLEWYDSDYSKAFELACEDKRFMQKANKVFIDMLATKNSIIVDNANVSIKRRRFFIDEAHKKGYSTTAVLFPAAVNEIMVRQHTRPDKTVPAHAVRDRYFNIQYPNFGDFQDIIVCDTNLPS
jgi:predicted kinase